MVLEESRVENLVQNLGVKIVECLLQGDTASLASFLNEGFVFRLAGGERLNKEQWLEMLSNGQFRYDSLTVEQTAVHVYDRQMAFVSGRSESRKTLRGRRVHGDFPYTALYVCRGGQWQIVAIHQLENRGSVATHGERGDEPGAFRP